MIPLSPINLTRLEKVAADNGFDQELAPEGEWLVFASTQCPLRIWLSMFAHTVFVAAFSQASVTRALAEYGTQITSPLPNGAVAGRTVIDLPSLHRMVRRAFQLSRTLPDEPLQRFERATAAMPRSTEAERLVVQRVGQDVFRDALIELWEGRCAVTRLGVRELLRASHIKPWADCDSDTERLDVFNGLLLAPHLDAAFDRGFISVSDSGHVLMSDMLTDAARVQLGLGDALHLSRLAEGHRRYLVWHRERLFKR
jgi:hypothetical protein